MPVSHFHLDSGQDTLAAVVVGAVLATAGGFLANQLEGRLRRRDEERSSALLFSEILSALVLILETAEWLHSRGEPFGPATLRTLKAAQHETRTYDRNRESLFTLRDHALRGRLHSLMLRFSIALDGVLEPSPRRTQPLDEGDGDESLERLSDQEGAFAYCLQLTRHIAPLQAQLQKLSGISATDYLETIRGDLRLERALSPLAPETRAAD